MRTTSKTPFVLWFVAALALALPCGAEVTLTPPAEPLSVGEYASIKVTGLDDTIRPGCVLDYWPETGATIIPAMTWGGEPLLLFSAKANGQYRIVIAYPEGGKAKLAKCVVKVGGEKPLPPPNPTPDPQPNPTPNPTPPSVGPLWIGLIFQSEALTPVQAAIVDAGSIVEYANAKGHTLVKLDPDMAKAATQWQPVQCPPGGCGPNGCGPQLSIMQPVTVPSSLDDRTKKVVLDAEAAGLPRIVAIKKQGGVTVINQAFPATVAEALALIKKQGGE